MRGTPIATLRRPEYTGENRCMPCTLTNLVIAAALSGGLFWLGSVLEAQTAGVVAAGGVLLCSLASIYLRGYLVPGTPTLTRRYFPRWALGLFGKQQNDPVSLDLESGASEALVAADVLEEAPEGGYTLAPAFEAAWTRAKEKAARVEDPAAAFEADGEIDVMHWNDIYRAYVDDEIVGKWRSEAAFVADLASASVLSEWLADWEDVSPAERTRILDSIRRHLGTCPDCGGTVEAGLETVRGCCSTFEANVMSCTDCEAWLYTPSCPDCGDAVEYVTEPIGADDPEDSMADAEGADTARMGTATCVDCDERVTSVPAFLSPPR